MTNRARQQRPRRAPKSATPKPIVFGAESDGISLLGLGSWLDEVDHDLIDLTSRMKLLRTKSEDANHSARSKALSRTLSRLGQTIKDLSEAMPVDLDGLPSDESRMICMGLIAQWLEREARDQRSMQTGLNGTTASFPLSRVLEFLSAQCKSGLLRVLARHETVLIELDEGDIIHAETDSSPDGERLGEILVGLGHLTQDDLQRVTSVPLRRTRIGAELVDRGFVTIDQLRAGLRQQTRSILQRLLNDEKALFQFQEEVIQRQSTRVRLSTMSILLETATTDDETSHDPARRSDDRPV